MTAEEIRKQLAQQQGGTNKQPAAPNLQGKVNDHSDYLNEMHRAQQEAARADLEAAYKKNVAAIDRAGAGVDKTYQDAKNQTVGTSEQAKRNFAQYAAAKGLNNGAGGQAELARSVALQKALGELDTKKAQTVADLDLQRTNVETDYSTAIAKAKAEGDYQKANALYQEKVRVENALGTALQQEFQNELNKYQLGYQAERDQVADDQWKQQFDFGKQQYIDQLALVHGKNAGETSWGGTGGGTTTVTPSAPTGKGYNNGSLTNEQIKQLQQAYNSATGANLAVDGFWGPNSQATTGMSADEAYQKYVVGGSNAGAGVNENFFNELVMKIKYQLSKGSEDGAYTNVSTIWPELSLQQRLEVQNALVQYGLQY